MDLIENTNPKFSTSSDLSEWVGPQTLTAPPAVIPRSVGETVEPDHLDWTERLLSLDQLVLGNDAGISIGPLSNSAWSARLNELFRLQLLQYSLSKYRAFSYDSVDVRFTMNDPKNLMGGVIFGWSPYVDYYDEDPPFIDDVLSGDDILWTGLVNGPYSQLALFGMSNDVSFKIPWTYKFSCYLSEWITLEHSGTGQDARPPWGAPLIWMKMLDSSYVTTIQNPAKVRIFCKFNGLKFYGPNESVGDVLFAHPQSGLETVVAAEIASVAASALGSAVGMGDAMYPTDNSVSATYEAPQAVQMAFFGDTTSVTFPPTSPIFSAYSAPSDVPIPSVLEILKRPQLIAISSDQVINLVNNPVAFRENTVDKFTTYFKWFAALNRFWRGTINFHVVVAGHAMVQQQLVVTVTYPGFILREANVPSTNVVHSTSFSGSKNVLVPCPFLDPRDYMPIYDKYPSDLPPQQHLSTTKIKLHLRIMSTMLDVTPTPIFYVFASAGDDFAFYQPSPPGLYRIADLVSKDEKKKTPSTPLPKTLVTSTSTKKKVIRATLQIGLPMSEQVETVRSRHKSTADPGIMVNMETLYDYMKLWSRCVPFYDYDNGGDQEPIPDADVGFKSVTWYPPVDRSRDLDSNNSWYFTLDYVAYLAQMFLYYRGGIGFKIGLATKNAIRPQDGYAYISLSDPVASYRQQSYCPFGFESEQLPPQCNFGAGTVVTPINMQPVMDLTIPYRGTNVWSYCINNANYRGIVYNTTSGLAFDTPNAAVDHNIVLQDPMDDKLADAMFRKIDTDFALALEIPLPPPTMWLAKGFDWSL